MTVVPDGEPLNIHVVENDIFTAVLHVGNVIEGGETNFYDGVSADNPGNIVHHEPFVHGKVQIVYFDKVYHGVGTYKGERYDLNFIMKKVYLNTLISTVQCFILNLLIEVIIPMV